LFYIQYRKAPARSTQQAWRDDFMIPDAVSPSGIHESWTGFVGEALSLPDYHANVK
jgi:hypothetical protein